MLTDKDAYSYQEISDIYFESGVLINYLNDLILNIVGEYFGYLNQTRPFEFSYYMGPEYNGESMRYNIDSQQVYMEVE